MIGAYVIAGAKGGVGKTTTAINIGAVAASNGYDTVVVELDLPMANVVDLVTLDADIQSPTTLYDVLTDEASIGQAVYETHSGLSVVPSGTSVEGYAETDISYLAGAHDWLTEEFDLVIYDTPAGLSRETVVPVRLADGMVLVSSPRVASVRNAQNTGTLADRCDTTVAGLVLTKAGTGKSPDAERIAEFLDVTLLGHVPEDDAVSHSQDHGKPVVVHAPQSDAAIAYYQITGQLVDGELSREPIRGAAGTDSGTDGFTPEQTEQERSTDSTGVPASDRDRASDAGVEGPGPPRESGPSEEPGPPPAVRRAEPPTPDTAGQPATAGGPFTRSASSDAPPDSKGDGSDERPPDRSVPVDDVTNSPDEEETAPEPPSDTAAAEAAPADAAGRDISGTATEDAAEQREQTDEEDSLGSRLRSLVGL